MIDTATEFGQRVARRLRDDPVIWLVTVGSDGMPVPSPVWFYWDDHSVLIYSRPDTLKLHNIQRNPNVALHFDTEDRTGRGGHDGENVVIISGRAQVDPEAPPADKHTGVIAKYVESGRCAAWNVSPAVLASKFTVAVRIKPTRVRGV